MPVNFFVKVKNAHFSLFKSLFGCICVMVNYFSWLWRFTAPVFVDGERTVTLKGDHIAREFQAIVQNYVERRYGALRVD